MFGLSLEARKNLTKKRGFMKKGFTIIEVSILFVIFLIVAFLVAPLSLDDTRQAKNTSRWRNVQQDFSNILYSANNEAKETSINFNEAFQSILENEINEEIPRYKISYKNGAQPAGPYKFDNFKSTYSNATIAIKFFDEPEKDLQGYLMYDVNGKNGPNTWGKDVFGLYIYKNYLEPFGKNESLAQQKQDCSKNGTGLFCSNYYLIGGNFD